MYFFKAPQQPNTPVQEDTAEPSSEISDSEFDSDSEFHSDSDGGISVISINSDSETDSANSASGGMAPRRLFDDTVSSSEDSLDTEEIGKQGGVQYFCIHTWHGIRGGSRMVGALRQTTWWGPLHRSA